MIKSFIKYCYLVLTLMLFSTTVSAIEVVRATIIDSNTHIVDIALFDNETPLTVTNFLNNINNNIYENLLFHRSINNFVIQTGGYSFDSTLGDFSYAGNDQFNGGLQPTPNVTTVQNEFKLSNIRGTLAMAKSGTNVDSDSNQWFINLSDNTFLDTSNEGFTVFGEILDNGMLAIEQIASAPSYDLSADIDFDNAFTDVPLNNFTVDANTNEINDNNLIKTSLSRLFSLTDLIDFGDAAAGTSVQRSIVIHNISDNVLTMGNFDSAAILPPFNVINDGCSLTPLPASELCSIVIEFTPDTADFFETAAAISIETYTPFPITLKTPAPDIELTRENIDFGFQPVYDPDQGLPEQAVVQINNTGDRVLNFTSINFSSETVEDFEFFDNCTRVGHALTPGIVEPQAFCILVINFIPRDLFVKSATITIISDDPNESELTINITGGSSTDNDGIDSAIEDSSANNGDGNFDGSPDRLQNNVVSFPAASGVYTTLVADEDIIFTNVKAVQLSTIEALPGGTNMDNEAFAFELSGFPAGSIAEFGLILPAGHTPANIYSFGPTTDNNTPHWYTLEKNTIPGVFIFGDVSLIASSGESVSRNVSTIRILDGGDGDSDQLANGTIVFVGGPEINNQTSSSSGVMLWMLFLAPFLILIYRNSDDVGLRGANQTYEADSLPSDSRR